MLKKYYKKIGKKQDNDVDVDMAQLERNNNKMLRFSFQIYIDIDYYYIFTVVGWVFALLVALHQTPFVIYRAFIL